MKSELKHIVTHPGTAHRADFLAVAIALANSNNDPTIYRRVPTEADLNSPDILVLDIGGSYSPENLNFDPHCLSKDTEPACALSLLADEMGMDGFLRGANKWYEVTELLDSRGPMTLGKFLGAEWRALVQMFSPVESFLLRKFSGLTELKAGDPLYAMMAEMGNDMLKYAVDFAARIQLLDNEATLLQINGEDVLFVPESVRGADEMLALEAWRNERCPKVHIVVSPDPKGPGLSICRVHDMRRIDFSVLEGHPKITFAHARGYIAKTTAVLPVEEVADMIYECIREPQAPPAPQRPQGRWQQRGNGYDNNQQGRNYNNQGNRQRQPQHRGNGNGPNRGGWNQQQQQHPQQSRPHASQVRHHGQPQQQRDRHAPRVYNPSQQQPLNRFPSTIPGRGNDSNPADQQEIEDDFVPTNPAAMQVEDHDHEGFLEHGLEQEVYEQDPDLEMEDENVPTNPAAVSAP